jgi:serine phosphatase RsbU (regulator of sigma subunit)
MSRLRELFSEQQARAASEIPAGVLEAITRFERGARAADDKTIVVMRRSSS